MKILFLTKFRSAIHKKANISSSNTRNEGNFFEENDFEFDDPKNKNDAENKQTQEADKKANPNDNNEEPATQSQSNCLLIDFGQPEIEIPNNQQVWFYSQMQIDSIKNQNMTQQQINNNNSCNPNQQIVNNLNINHANNHEEGNYQNSNGHFNPINNVDINKVKFDKQINFFETKIFLFINC